MCVAVPVEAVQLDSGCGGGHWQKVDEERNPPSWQKDAIVGFLTTNLMMRILSGKQSCIVIVLQIKISGLEPPLWKVVSQTIYIFLFLFFPEQYLCQNSTLSMVLG